MKNIFIIVTLFLLCVQTQAQVTVTRYQGNVANLIQQYFISDESVELDLSFGHEPKFNGQTSTNSLQIGTFTNPDITGNNMPLSSGIIMTTGSYEQAGYGTASGVESNTYPGFCRECGDMSPSLHMVYQNQGGTYAMNDVACMSFWIIPKSDMLSFSYVFASEEYPEFVCSIYNDVFGFFVSGPYDENGNLVTSMGDVYTNENIAIVPNTNLPVMINTVNGGTSAVGTTNCHLDNSQYFIRNYGSQYANDNCRMNGYTVDLTTKKIEVVPCYRYRIELAIANISDNQYNSAVYLKANSLHADRLNLDVAGNNDVTTGVYTKGCGRAKVSLTANYEVASVTQYSVQISSSGGSSLTLGEDYILVDDNNQEVGTTVTLARNQNEAHFFIDFLHNPNKEPLSQDTLYVITEYVNECTPRDTIILVCQEPSPMTFETQGGKTYCDNELPITENILVSTEGAYRFMKVNITNSINANSLDTTIYRNEDVNTPQLFFTYNPIITAPIIFYIAVEDSCGRTFFDTIEYKIQGANTSASVSNNYICEGDQITLSCTQAEQYTWSAEPTDQSLFGQENMREPSVSPLKNTKYTVTIKDENGCIASANVDVEVIANVKARMSLSSHTLTLSSATLMYEDVTINGADRFWDLGDGTTSTSVSGVENYPATDSGSYQIMLVVYNSAGCADTVYDTIRVVPDFTFYVPNAFVPGEDGQAIGIFAPVGSMLEYFTLDVYNRWGTKIFSGKENQGWNGRLENNELAPQGTYIYDIFYKDGSGLLQRKTGTFTALPKDKK